MQTANTTLGQLKAAMQKKGDMPSLSSALSRIVEVGQQADTNEMSLANVVLSDFSMAQKVLRLANSAMYASFGSITTISRAIYVLGSDVVIHLAMGVKMLDNLGQAVETDVAREELSKAVVAGAIARNLATKVSGKEGESAAVSTLMRSLGRLLVCFYLPERYNDIKKAASSSTEDAAATNILGLGFHEVAREVALSWNLPVELADRTSPPAADASEHAHWLHNITEYSRAYADVAASGAPATALESLAAKYADSIGTEASKLLAVSATAVQDHEREVCKPGKGIFSGNRAEEPVDAAAQLAAGISEIEQTQEFLPLARVMSMATEVLWTSLRCRNAFFFLRNGIHSRYDLLLAHGERSQELVRKVSFEEAFSPNVVHLALTNGAPVYLANAQEPNIARRIPDWLTRAVRPARSIFLMPFLVQGKARSLLYLDWGPDREFTKQLTELEREQIERLQGLVSRCMERALAARAQLAETA